MFHKLHKLIKFLWTLFFFSNVGLDISDQLEVQTLLLKEKLDKDFFVGAEKGFAQIAERFRRKTPFTFKTELNTFQKRNFKNIFQHFKLVKQGGNKDGHLSFRLGSNNPFKIQLNNYQSIITSNNNACKIVIKINNKWNQSIVAFKVQLHSYVKDHFVLKVKAVKKEQNLLKKCQS